MLRLLTRFIFRPWWRLSRGMTVGVRAVVTRDGTVLLVRHSYVPGWHLPGGGVERGETVLEALTHELIEEANVFLEGEPRLFGVYSSEPHLRGDHVLLYVADAWRQDGPYKPGMEILEAAFFPLEDLPDGTTPGTRRRLAEVFGEAAQDDHW